jgi:hypothetical protein
VRTIAHFFFFSLVFFGNEVLIQHPQLTHYSILLKKSCQEKRSQNNGNSSCNDGYKYEICNKHQEETFNYERGKEENTFMKKISSISLCMLKGTQMSKMKTYINVSLVNIQFSFYNQFIA